MKKIAIAAVAKNGVIGKDGKLPWHIPEEMKFFVKTTTFGTCIVGRKTFDGDIRAKFLSHRDTIVLTSENRKPMHNFREKCSGDTILFVKDLSSAFLLSEAYGAETYFIGGASVYAQAIPICDEMLISRIRVDYEGDVYFPKFDESQFTKEIIKEDKEFYVEKYTKKEAV